MRSAFIHPKVIVVEGFMFGMAESKLEEKVQLGFQHTIFCELNLHLPRVLSVYSAIAL